MSTIIVVIHILKVLIVIELKLSLYKLNVRKCEKGSSNVSGHIL